MPGESLASVVDDAATGRRVVTGLAVEAATVTVVAGGTRVVAVASVVVVVGTAVVVVEMELVVTISLDGAAAGDGFGEQAAVATTAIARTSDRASTRRTYAAAP